MQVKDVYKGVLAGFLVFLTFARSSCDEAAGLAAEPTLDVAVDGSGFLEAVVIKLKENEEIKVDTSGRLSGSLGKGLFSAPWADARLQAQRSCNAATDGGRMQSVDQRRSSLMQLSMRSSQLNDFVREGLWWSQALRVGFPQPWLHETVLCCVAKAGWRFVSRHKRSWVGPQRGRTACRWNTPGTCSRDQ